MALALSAISAYAANIKITALPLAITKPGTYVLTGNLTSPSSGNAITIDSSVAGPVVLDLKGFSLNGIGGFSTAVFIGNFSGGTPVLNAFPITIRNGSILNFGFGVWAENGGTTDYLSDISVSNIVFQMAQNSANDATAILFNAVNNSTISGCAMSGGDWCIRDGLSLGGNVYTNWTFFGNDGLWVLPANSTVLNVNRVSFGSPAGD